MRHIIAAALLSSLALPALAQASGEVVDVGGWKVSRVGNPDGSFKQCNATMVYDDGSVLAFVANKDQKVFVVLVEPTYKLKEGQAYKAEVSIDKGAAARVDAIAPEPTMLVIPIADDATFMPAAMAGNALFIEAAGKVSESPLEGSGKAIAQLGACAVAGTKGG